MKGGLTPSRADERGANPKPRGNPLAIHPELAAPPFILSLSKDDREGNPNSARPRHLMTHPPAAAANPKNPLPLRGRVRVGASPRQPAPRRW